MGADVKGNAGANRRRRSWCVPNVVRGNALTGTAATARHAGPDMRGRGMSRRREMSRSRAHPAAGRPVGAPDSLGPFVPHDTRPPSLHEELQRWQGASADHVSAELIGINRAIAGVLERQVAALERVYRGLRLLLVLAAAMLALVGAAWCLRAAA
jgi:hypothetical protein